MSRSGFRWQCHTLPVGMRLMSSTQPISTTLWPSKGSSPVVSVSRTISRKMISLVLAAQPVHHAPVPAFKRFDQFIDLDSHVREAEAAVHNVVGPRHALGVGKLAGEKMFELVGGHAGTREHAGALHVLRRAHNHGDIDAGIGAGLEQERYL